MSSHKTIDDEDSQILPVGWRKCWSVRKARVYYFNLESGNSSWERPTDVTQIGLFQEHDSSAEKTVTSTEKSTSNTCQTSHEEKSDRPVKSRRKLSLDSTSSENKDEKQVKKINRKRNKSSSSSFEDTFSLEYPFKRLAKQADKVSETNNIPNSTAKASESEADPTSTKISFSIKPVHKITKPKPSFKNTFSATCVQTNDEQLKKSSHLEETPHHENAKYTDNASDVKVFKSPLSSQEAAHTSTYSADSGVVSDVKLPASTETNTFDPEDGSLTPRRMARIQSWVASLDSKIEENTPPKPKKQPVTVKVAQHTPKNAKVTPTKEQESAAEEDMDVDAEAENQHEQMEIINDVLEMREILQMDNQEPTGELTKQLVGPKSTNMQTYIESCSNKPLCVVIDTNVLLEDLNFLDDLKDQKFKGLGRPCLLIPWIVLQELDAIKDSRCVTQVSLSLRTQARARSAVNFLHTCLNAKHPRVLFQSPQQAYTSSDFKIECNDDRILQSCMQARKKGNAQEVVLLTMDKNLRNKAMVLSIPTYNRESLLSWLQYLHPNNEDSGNNKHISNKCEQNLGDELQCEARRYLRTALTAVLETEMIEAYGINLWSTIVHKKPPWTLLDVLDCLHKHWIAVFGHVVKRASKKYLNSLREHFHPGKGNVKSLDDVWKMLKEGVHLIDSFKAHSQYEGALTEPTEKLNYLEKVCEAVCSGGIPASNLASLLTMIPQLTKKQDDPSADFYDPSSPTCDTGVSELDFMGVQHAFQTIWEAILYFRECMEQRLTLSVNENPGVRSGNVTAFIRFFSAALLIHTAYNRMLTVKDIEVNANLTTFCQLCHALNNFAHNFDIQPWQLVSGDKLKNFFLQDKNRAILRNGFLQLEQLIAGIEESKTLLHPEEKVLVEAAKLSSNRTNFSGVSGYA